MAKYMKTEQGYMDISILVPKPFKPSGKSYLTFSSLNSFTLAVRDATKHWNGTLEYFTSDETWTIWDGTSTLSAVVDDGEYVLYLRGSGNTVITGYDIDYRWVLTGSDIACVGNIENLLDYATVESGAHPPMAVWCYNSMFQGCTALTQAPALPATTLADQCYSYIFKGCTSLKLSSTKTDEYTQEYRIPSSGDGITASKALFNMFASTGGTFTGTPAINTTYYLSSNNMIVRETDISTLNGYVGSMINNAAPTPDTTLSIAGKSADAKATGDAIRALSEEIPTVFDWAKKELFDKADLVDPAGINSFLTIDGVEYYRYHCGPNNFEWNNPKPYPGSVTITARAVSQYGGTNGTRLLTIYDDGTYGPTLYVIVGGESKTVTVTTDPDKTLAKITGNYDMENWALLDMSVMSIVANYNTGLPLANSNAPGGVIADPVTEEYTVPAKIGKDGKMYVPDIPVVDATLTQSGQAADAAKVGEELRSLSEEKANLPLAEDGTINAGISGQYATSDGEGGFNWEDGPATLPNPNALTFTGAVTGSYDGSAPLEVAIPSGGGASGDYIPIPASAEVGQTIVVKAVDEDGKPTEWEAVDVPSGGGEEAWDYEKTIVIEEEVASITIDTFDDGTPLALKKVEVILVGSNATSANQNVMIVSDVVNASNGGAVALGGGTYLTADKKHYLWGIAEINNGEIAAEFAQSNNQTQYVNFYTGISSAITKVKPGITYSTNNAEIYPNKATKFISITANVPAGAFAVGTTLRIKGVMV